MHNKPMNVTPIVYGGRNLLFYKTKYTDGSTAVICETDIGEPYATVSINLIDYGYITMPNEIFFNHDLTTDFKQMFIENFCDCTLRSAEKVMFGPYDVETEKVTIESKYIR